MPSKGYLAKGCAIVIKAAAVGLLASAAIAEAAPVLPNLIGGGPCCPAYPAQPIALTCDLRPDAHSQTTLRPLQLLAQCVSLQSAQASRHANPKQRKAITSVGPGGFPIRV